MVTRIAGIVAGVMLTLFFTVTILPTSAHSNIDIKLKKALRELLTLHSLCWSPMKNAMLVTRAELAATDAARQQGAANGDDPEDNAFDEAHAGAETLLDMKTDEVCCRLAIVVGITGPVKVHRLQHSRA